MLNERHRRGRSVLVRGYISWVLLYVLLVGGSLVPLALFDVWGGFWIVAFVGVWVGVWIAFSAFWCWADETRRLLLRRRGYY